jgi:hypothetical protein
MTIYVSLPGQTATPVIVPDNATLQQFAVRAQEVTGCSSFSGFTYPNPLGVQTETEQSGITNAQIWDNTSNGWVSLADVPYTTALSTIFNNGDSILLTNVAIGG